MPKRRTHSHGRPVQAYALGLARALGAPMNDVEGLEALRCARHREHPGTEHIRNAWHAAEAELNR